VSDAVRCAQWARGESVDPVGTAGCYRGFLLLEWPLPWPRDLTEVAALAPVHEVAAAAGLRVQAVLPADGPGPARRAVLHRSVGAGDDGWFAGFEPVERASTPGHEVATAVDLVVSGDGDRVRTGDVLVCTHGARDVCCGAMGTAVAGSLAADVHFTSEVRLWRTSHTGGHRFAPTSIVLPEATVWAYLDGPALAGIVRRDDPVDEHLFRYRGCAGLPSPAAQAVERMALAAAGWDVLDRPRRHTDLGGGRHRLEVGGLGTWEAEVADGRRLPVPVCGQPVETAPKYESELVVTSLPRQ